MSAKSKNTQPEPCLKKTRLLSKWVDGPGRAALVARRADRDTIQFVSGWDSGGQPALGAIGPACGLGVLADSCGGLARHPDGQWVEGSRFQVGDLLASLGCCAGAWLFKLMPVDRLENSSPGANSA